MNSLRIEPRAYDALELKTTQDPNKKLQSELERSTALTNSGCPIYNSFAATKMHRSPKNSGFVHLTYRALDTFSAVALSYNSLIKNVGVAHT